jgi:hypothetical protein
MMSRPLDTEAERKGYGVSSGVDRASGLAVRAFVGRCRKQLDRCITGLRFDVPEADRGTWTASTAGFDDSQSKPRGFRPSSRPPEDLFSRVPDHLHGHGEPTRAAIIILSEPSVANVSRSLGIFSTCRAPGIQQRYQPLYEQRQATKQDADCVAISEHRGHVALALLAYSRSTCARSMA